MGSSQKRMNFGHLPCDTCRHLCLERKLLHHLDMPFNGLQKLKFELCFFGIVSGSYGNCPDVLNSALEQHSWVSPLYLQSLTPNRENRDMSAAKICVCTDAQHRHRLFPSTEQRAEEENQQSVMHLYGPTNGTRRKYRN